MKVRYWLLAGLAAATLSFAVVDSADARRGGGGGFRGGGGGIKFRSGGFRSFKPRSFRSFSHGRSFRKFGGQKFGHRSYGRSWAGKSHGKYRSHKPYRHAGKHGYGHGKHGWKKHDRGHSWKKDYGKYHKSRHFSHKGGHGWKGRDHSWKGHGHKKYVIDRGYAKGGSNVNVYASSGSGSGVDASSIFYAIAAFAAQNPHDDGEYEYHDRTTGYKVRYSTKGCDCGSDPDMHYENFLRRSCEDSEGIWKGMDKPMKERCEFPTKPLK